MSEDPGDAGDTGDTGDPSDIGVPAGLDPIDAVDGNSPVSGSGAYNSLDPFSAAVAFNDSDPESSDDPYNDADTDGASGTDGSSAADGTTNTGGSTYSDGTTNTDVGNNQPKTNRGSTNAPDDGDHPYSPNSPPPKTGNLYNDWDTPLPDEVQTPVSDVSITVTLDPTSGGLPATDPGTAPVADLSQGGGSRISAGAASDIASSLRGGPSVDPKTPPSSPVGGALGQLTGNTAPLPTGALGVLAGSATGRLLSALAQSPISAAAPESVSLGPQVPPISVPPEWANSFPSDSAMAGLFRQVQLGFRSPISEGFRGATGTATNPRALKTSVNPNIGEHVAYDAVLTTLDDVSPLIAPDGANVPGGDFAIVKWIREEFGLLRAQPFGVGVKSTRTEGAKFENDELTATHEQEVRSQLSAAKFSDPEQAEAVQRFLADPDASVGYIRVTVDYSPSGGGRIMIDGVQVPGSGLVWQGPAPYSESADRAPDEVADSNWSEINLPGEDIPSIKSAPEALSGPFWILDLATAVVLIDDFIETPSGQKLSRVFDYALNFGAVAVVGTILGALFSPPAAALAPLLFLGSDSARK